MRKRTDYAPIAKMQEQPDLFFGDVRYILLLSAIISGGIANRIGPVAFCVFVCLRSHAQYNTGLVSVGHRLIASQMGISVGSVSKAISTLQENNLIEVLQDKKGTGGRNIYKLVDKIPVYQDEKPAGIMKWDFQPLEVMQRLNEARQILHTGEVPSKSPITLSLTINIVQHNGTGDIIINSASDTATQYLENMPDSMKSFFSKMISEAK